MNHYINYNSIQNISLSEINIYFILEQDFFLSYEIQQIILKYYKKKMFTKIIKINITSKIIWNQVYYEYQQKHLFQKKKILLLTINKKYIDYNLTSKLHKIIKYNNSNIILLLRCINTKYKNNINFFKKITKKNQIIINCPYLTRIKTKKWITNKIKNMNFFLKPKIIHILSYYYEKNLLMLFKILQILKILYLNTDITEKDIQDILIDHISFSIKYWINLLFLKKKLQAIKLLMILKKQKYKISYLLYNIQNNLIYLIHIKEGYIYKNYLNNNKKNIIFLDKNFKNIKIIKNINNFKIYKIINILTIIELNYKKYKNELLWQYLKILITLF